MAYRQCLLDSNWYQSARIVFYLAPVVQRETENLEATLVEPATAATKSGRSK